MPEHKIRSNKISEISWNIKGTYQANLLRIQMCNERMENAHVNPTEMYEEKKKKHKNCLKITAV